MSTPMRGLSAEFRTYLPSPLGLQVGGRMRSRSRRKIASGFVDGLEVQVYGMAWKSKKT